MIGSDEFAAGTAPIQDLAAAQSAVTIDWHGGFSVLVDVVQSPVPALRAR